MTLTGTNTSNKSEPGSNGYKVAIPRSLKFEPHYWIQFSVIPKTPFFVGSGSSSSSEDSVGVFKAPSTVRQNGFFCHARATDLEEGQTLNSNLISPLIWELDVKKERQIDKNICHIEKSYQICLDLIK